VIADIAVIGKLSISHPDSYLIAEKSGPSFAPDRM
jgi:hypothetical protein